MTKKLRIRFVALSMLALTIMQSLIIFFFFYNSYHKMTSSADEIIATIFRAYPQAADVDARYFVVTFDNYGEVSNIDLSHIVTVKRKGADTYGKNALNSDSDRGFVDSYRYEIFRTQGEITMVFLARGGNIEALKSNIITYAMFSLAGILVMCGFLIAASCWLTRPITISRKKQKEFVTAASHEMKTPLTVISADADILLYDHPDNRWVQDIRIQAKRLTDMTHSLIALARMDEQEHTVTRIDFPVSDVAEDVAKSYDALASKESKKYSVDISPNLSYSGDENMIRQLFSILLDNAFKYCTENGDIDFSLKKDANGIFISVTNTAENVGKEQLSRFFDRFYRSDNTVASKKDGYGLGLSIAAGIVEKHNGKIAAASPENGVIQITAILK